MPVRLQGVAGNIATGSPISDLNPIWMASGSRVVLISKTAQRTVTIDDKFFVGYRKTVIQPTEIIYGLWIPFTTQVLLFCETFKFYVLDVSFRWLVSEPIFHDVQTSAKARGRHSHCELRCKSYFKVRNIEYGRENNACVWWNGSHYENG